MTIILSTYKLATSLIRSHLSVARLSTTAPRLLFKPSIPHARCRETNSPFTTLRLPGAATAGVVFSGSRNRGQLIVISNPASWSPSLASSFAATRKSLSTTPLDSPLLNVADACCRKAQDKQQQQKLQKWDRIDQNTLGKGQYFGHNFSRPSLAVPTCLRPGTASGATTAPGPRSWHAVFGNSGAASSMTDLKPPVMRGLRHNASEVNLRSHHLAQDSTATLALPSTSKWMDPLQAHSCHDVSHARSDTAPAAKTGLPCQIPPFSKLDLQMGEPLGIAKSTPDHGAVNGCPSPPQSDGVSEPSYFPYHPSMGRVSPDSRPASSRCNAPSALRHVDTASIGARPPSPAPSPPCTRDGPGPFPLGLQRRQTCKLDFGDQSARRTRHNVEGFIGNFADFDFGASVSRAGNSPVTTRAEALGVATGAQSKVDHWLRQPEMPLERLPSHASAPSLLGPRPTTASGPVPSVICEESEYAGGSLASSMESHFHLEFAVTAVSAQIFPARVDSKPQTTREHAPQPSQPVPSSPSADQAEPSPYGPSAQGEGDSDTQLPHRPSGPHNPSPHSRRPLEGHFSKSKGGLPRGRLVEPPVLPLSSPEPNGAEEESECDENHATDEDEDSGPILPEWPSFDNSSHRHSAVPPPLSTASRSPARSIASSAPSTAAPRLPSPTFPSLTTSISGSSLGLANSFELALAESLGSGWGLPLDRIPSANSGLGGNTTRVEAAKAPPRPEAPISLSSPSSDRVAGMQTRSRVEGTFDAGFI